MSDKEQALEVLRTARDVVLADEDAWCQGSYAENSVGNPCWWADHDATAFCRMGAVYRATQLHALTDAAMRRAANLARHALDYVSGPPELINDGPDTTYSSTIDDFDRAIKKLEES